MGVVVIGVAVVGALNRDKLEPLLTKAEGGGSETKVSAPAAPAIPVKSAVVKSRLISERLRAVGNLYPRQGIDITPSDSGFIEAIPVAEGAKVKKGDVLLMLDSETARAAVADAKAQLTLDQQAYRRQKDLVDKGYGARQDLEQAQAKLATAKANVTRNERVLQERRVLAPFDGVIGRLSYSLGAFVSPGDVVAKLYDNQTLFVDVRVSDGDVSRIHSGMVFDMQNGISDAVIGQGVLTFVSPEMDPTTRSILVRGEIPNDDGGLLPGMFIVVSLTVEQKSDAVTVPADALVYALSGTYVFKIVDGKAQRVPVKVGLEENGNVEILSGVAVSDTVITEGRSRVRHGMAVSVAGS